MIKQILVRNLTLLTFLNIWSCAEQPTINQLENSTQMSATLTVKTRGAAITLSQSAKDQKHHILKVTPYAPDLVIDLEHTGCAIERVHLLIPQHLPYATIQIRPYLGGQDERNRTFQNSLQGLTWTQDPSTIGWTPIDKIQNSQFVFPTAHESLISLELRRNSAYVQQINDQDPLMQDLLKVLSSERSLQDRALPTLESLPPSPPCTTLNSDQALSSAPLIVRLSFNLYDQSLLTPERDPSNQQTQMGILSGIRWSEDRNTQVQQLISELNEAQLDLVILLGDLTQGHTLYEIEGLRRTLGTLISPWVTTIGNEDAWLDDQNWYENLGFNSFGFDRGALRIGVMNTIKESVGREERALIQRWGKDEHLLWTHLPSPQVRLLLSHHPFLPKNKDRGQRAEAIKLLNLTLENKITHLLSALEGEIHPGLKQIKVPDLIHDQAWLKLVFSENCDQQIEACLTLTTIPLARRPE